LKRRIYDILNILIAAEAVYKFEKNVSYKKIRNKNIK
jgi:hypothetical protein